MVMLTQNEITIDEAGTSYRVESDGFKNKLVQNQIPMRMNLHAIML